MEGFERYREYEEFQLLMHFIVQWKDLIALRAEGIEVEVHESCIREALLGDSSNTKVLPGDVLFLGLQRTGTGNLNLSWKLKGKLGLTVKEGGLGGLFIIFSF